MPTNLAFTAALTPTLAAATLASALTTAIPTSTFSTAAPHLPASTWTACA